MRNFAGARRANVCDSYIGFGVDCQKAKNGLSARFQPRSVSKPLSDTSGAQIVHSALNRSSWELTTEILDDG